MLIAAIVLIAVVVLSRRDEPTTPQGAGEAATEGGVKGGARGATFEGKDYTFEDAGKGLGAAGALAASMKAAASAAGGGATAGAAGAATTGAAAVATAASLQATGEAAISGAIQGAASAASSTAPLAVGLGSVLGVTIVFAWFALLVNIFNTMSAKAAKLKKRASAGLPALQLEIRTRIHGAERDWLEQMILANGGQIQTESRADEGNWDKITAVTNIAPDLLKSIVVLCRVMACEQARGYNSALASYYRNEWGSSNATLHAYAIALPPEEFQAEINTYYLTHPATTWGLLHATPRMPQGAHRHTMPVLVMDTYEEERDMVVSQAGGAMRLAQAFFTGELAAIGTTDAAGERFTILDGSNGSLMTDALAAAALTPAGNNMVAATNRTFFNNRLRQVAEALFDDSAKLGFFAAPPFHSPPGTLYGPTNILKQPGA